MILFYGWGFNEAEIGNLFGISESRVCQRLKRVQEGLSKRIAAQERRESAGELAKVLCPQAEGVRWTVGKVSFARMEIGKSWGVESYSEASF